MNERYLLYLEVLKKFTSETNKKKKEELAEDLQKLRDGFIPIKYLVREGI